MTYEGFLRIGGVEVINTERTRGYLETADCPRGLIISKPCDTLADAVGDEAYNYAAITEAPWYDHSLPDLSSRFYGVAGLQLAGITDSTREAGTTEGTDAGGVIGRTRKGMRSTRVRATIFADGADALEYGEVWLNAVFDGTCSMHGGGCGVTDAEFLAACPPARVDLTDEEYVAKVNALRRYLHDVGVTSGPSEVQVFRVPGTQFYGKIIEWTLTSERAWVYGATKELTLVPSLPSVVQDTPYNLIPYPSAELGGPWNVIALTNLSTNPGVEVDATGWVGESAIVSGSDPAPFVTSGRSTDIGAGGSSASFRVRLLGNNGTTVASGSSGLVGYQDASIGAGGSGRRISLNLWAACLVLAGSPTTEVTGVTLTYQFYNGAAPLGVVSILSSFTPDQFSGHSAALAAIAVPATATKVRVRAVAAVTWASTATAGQNSDIRLYADALTVSAP